MNVDEKCFYVEEKCVAMQLQQQNSGTNNNIIGQLSSCKFVIEKQISSILQTAY